MTRIYFISESERDAYNNKEALLRGCDGIYTKYWYDQDNDSNGFYMNVDDEPKNTDIKSTIQYEDNTIVDSSSTKTHFELWEMRVDVIKKLKDEGVNSPLELIPYITSWFSTSEDKISDFISTGSDLLLNEVLTNKEIWWDMKVDDSGPSPREMAIGLIKPLTVSKTKYKK